MDRGHKKIVALVGLDVDRTSALLGISSINFWNQQPTVVVTDIPI